MRVRGCVSATRQFAGATRGGPGAVRERPYFPEAKSIVSKLRRTPRWVRFAYLMIRLHAHPGRRTTATHLKRGSNARARDGPLRRRAHTCARILR
jgi:hypothetical protein